MNSDFNEGYVMLPNNAVQNINSIEANKPSLIQLYGKRTIAYLKQLIELQNINENIYFSIDMIMWKLNIKNNIKRERIYFKEFLFALNNNSLISFYDKVNPMSLSANDFIIARLNIYDYKEDTDNKYKINYFNLQQCEYNKINYEYLNNLDKYNLLNLFCNIKSRIKKNPENISPVERQPEVSYPSYETIMKDIFIESDKTLKQYIDTLFELDLIRYNCAGDMIFKIEGSSPIRRKANFTYTLFKPQWEIELDNAISLFKSRKKLSGWEFLTKDKEISSNEKRSITQKINILEKLNSKSILTQTQKKELAKLKRQQEKWKQEYDNKVNIRDLEESKLKVNNPDKKLSEIYDDMGLEAKAKRAFEEEEEKEEKNIEDKSKPKGLQNKKLKSLPLPKIDEYEKGLDVFEDWFNINGDNNEENDNYYTDETIEKLDTF
jgi:hypothetical protein